MSRISAALALLSLLASPAMAATEAERFPHMMTFLKGIVAQPMIPTPAGNENLVTSPIVFQPEQDLWDGFFKAAVEDKLTNLRALTLIAREFRNRKLTVYGTGTAFEDSVAKNKIDLGLAIPARNIGLAIWEPDPSIEDPDFLLHLRVIYREQFIHQFPDEVMTANLKIGYGEEVDYYFHEIKRHGYLMSADLYYGPKGIGFRNVKGVGAQKRGFTGFLQRLFFFIPDAVTSMLIDEAHNRLVTEAFINTEVENFETRDIYRIHYRDQPGK